MRNSTALTTIQRGIACFATLGVSTDIADKSTLEDIGSCVFDI